LVGADETLRSESRFYVESPSAYGDLMKSLNVPEIDKILSQETTVTIQNVNSSSAKQALSGNSGFDIIEDYRGVKVLSSYSPVVFGNLKWAILAEIDEEEAFSSINELEKTMTTSTLAGVVVLTTVFSILSMILAAKLIKPLVEIGEYFKKLNSGSADLTYAIPDSPTPEVNAISHSFNTFVNRLREIIDEVKSNSLIVASASEELSVSTGQSSNAAQEQLKQAKDVKESVSEHSQNASEGMSDAKLRTAEDRDLSAKASDNINKLVAEVNESASTIAHLKDEVQNINDVLVVINGIADQTNLLALNAAIEAARAGEHGRGFSVVADEVRTLASSTQKSTIDIQDKIKTLTTVAENAVNSMERASNSATQGVELVESVSSGLNNISKNIESLATINHQVATASGEQKTASQIINANVGKVSDASEQLSGAALESKQAAQELANVSNNLQQLVSGFKTINE
jgi:methyl-accepting chemotaxis protein